MVNTSIGTPVDRLAAVNALILKQGGCTCLDYIYKKMIGDMNNVSWESDGALGGSKPVNETHAMFANFFLQTKNIIYFSATMDLSNMH